MEGGELGESRVWTAALVVIGDEILSGRTQDRNIAQIATWLNVQGIRLAEVRVVPDVEERIAEADKGVFISSEAMLHWIESWGTENELPPPEPDVFLKPHRS